MKAQILSVALLLMSSVGQAVQAQTFTYVVSGMVAPCASEDSVQLHVSFYFDPPMDTLVAVDAGTCTFTATFTMTSDYPFVTASIPCNGTIAYASDSTFFSFPNDVLEYDTLHLDCGGLIYDCSGLAAGPNLPGTPCDDGNPTTTNELWQPDCSCIGDTTNLYDCLGILGGPNMPGTPCNDYDSLNVDDVWAPDCSCQGAPFEFDCNGVQNGPAMPGTACDDGDPLTVGDFWSLACTCIGYPATPCAINFQITQALEYDSATATTTPIPNTLWAMIPSAGQWPFAYFWDFGDGSSSIDPFPTHTYAGNGPYDLCVTITDGIGCTSTTCSPVSVDEDGMIIGMGLDGTHAVTSHQRSGFTLQIVNELPTSVTDIHGAEEVSIWPNPATDRLNLRMRCNEMNAVNLSIIDVNGHVVHAQRTPTASGINTISLTIADLPAGIYLLHLDGASSNWSSRFVKVD